MNNLKSSVKFDEKGLVPVVTQDTKTKEVLMVAYMNEEAFDKTIETGKVHYYSRSRSKLWLKGETSGHFQLVKSIKLDCDGDTILIEAEQIDAACHTGNKSCFYRTMVDGEWKENEEEKPTAAILHEVYNVIVDRNVNPKEGSYTNYLFTKGLDKILKKVGEEAAEVIIAAKNKSKEEIRYEVSDLMYHLMVLLVERGLTLEDIYGELKGRR
ncbi:phosphoribosyl-ATP diphosphatase [Ruminiclostridium papyrosolvens DSM 2782]|uniref:Histidine biosynthesis bifunctional protein HisIE n=1 Tax=Ruminiclostridium papyrosolvens DSM 2782 TaxID=588581 RepID=F1TE29_9FIRM|nr:bifunctional phosphoribosyl-AMP cyclohydrolase/phosphoribosyl-ATP diphosphatase HisIE [Ruminiclostridium papyrosolvens]EGD47475.1 phosphoribosyl-ATP diphosphatase [Ruminiclostridium papyrosolvens DSM 2782]WES34820.1 bifunctional phosphoribosyl-AMP cyclohydrolase/phosphoribosyl-ATP diphosphatase HisIE [Ruminiclostridium papyrosolvens DSM 2782]